jgi:cytochrome c2
VKHSPARLAAWLATTVVLAGCSAVERDALQARATDALREHGCIYCHQIDGVTGAHGRGGPSLTGLGRRAFIAGSLPNTEENVVNFIIAPPAYSPGTAMPVTGIGPEQAREVAVFLRRQAP